MTVARIVRQDPNVIRHKHGKPPGSSEQDRPARLAEPHSIAVWPDRIDPCRDHRIWSRVVLEPGLEGVERDNNRKRARPVSAPRLCSLTDVRGQGSEETGIS